MREYLIDCDGVMADLVGGTTAALGRPGWVPARSWDFLSNLPEPEKQRALGLWKQPGFIRKLPVIRGAQRGIERLRADAPVRVVTAMEAEGRPGRLEWLWEHFRIDEAQVSFALDKSGVPGRALLDDHHRHLEAWSAVQRRRAFMFAAPHNAGHPWPHRAENWEEAVPLLLAAR